MIKISALLFVGLLATLLLRRRSAALRHWVLASAIACAALMPALELVVPAWRLPAGVSWLAIRGEPLAIVAPLRLAPMEETEVAAPGEAAARDYRASLLGARQWVWLAGTGVGVLLLLIGFGRLAWFASRSRRVAHGTWFDWPTRSPGGSAWIARCCSRATIQRFWSPGDFAARR